MASGCCAQPSTATSVTPAARAREVRDRLDPGRGEARQGEEQQPGGDEPLGRAGEDGEHGEQVLPAAPTVATRWPASGPIGRRARLVATTRSRAAAVARTSVRGRSASATDVASRPVDSRATATDADTSWESRRTEIAEVTSVAASTTTATASWPAASTPPRGASTAPASRAKVTGRTRTRVSAGLVRSPPAHHPATQSTPRKAETTQPPPCATTGARHGRTEDEEHGEQLAAPAAGQVQPTERDQAGEHEPRRRRDPAVAAGDRHDVEVGGGGAGGDQGHRRAPDRLPVASVGLPAADPEPGERRGERGTGADPGRGTEPPALGGQHQEHGDPGHRDDGSGDGQHAGHGTLAAVPGDGRREVRGGRRGSGRRPRRRPAGRRAGGRCRVAAAGATGGPWPLVVACG